MFLSYFSNIEAYSAVKDISVSISPYFIDS
nr:MAG TPA: hypothetical protein [Caudoviricetes sp.]